jgi:multidrug efflux pump subunit AcrA (membrane-fusion protein)
MTTLPLRVFQFCFLCAAVAGCAKHGAGEDEGDNPAVSAVVAVRTVPLIRGDLETVVTATGNTDAVRKEKILAPVAGVLLSLKCLEGTVVKKGDVLAVIQPRETHAAITGAKALLRDARTDAEREEAGRAMELAVAGANNLDVRATTDGVVSTRSAAEGEIVAENAELMTLLDLSTLVFVADVPLADVPRVRSGERATLMFQSLPGDGFAAVVEAVNPSSDPQSQSVKVRLRFSGEDQRKKRLLRAEMNGIARIVTGKDTGVLIVPKSALIRNDETDTYTVVIATPESLARVIPVEVGTRTDSVAAVAGKGLLPGDAVVVEGNYALADSTRIAPVR